MKKCNLKKLIGSLFLLLTLLRAPDLTWAQEQESEPVKVPVLMYHSLLNKSTNQWNISPDNFERDLQYLSENGYQAVFISDLIAYVHEGVPLPEKPIVLTFDDGYYNNYSNGIPLLKKYNMKMVLSVIGCNTDHWTEHADESDEQYGHLNWMQISQMVESGFVELANHTQNLHKHEKGRHGCCRKKGEDIQEYEQLLTQDVEILQDKLNEISGKYPECFTYPFGRHCGESTDILKKLGFKASLSCASGINYLRVGDPDCLIFMKRNNRTPGKSAESILKKLGA